VGLVARLPGGDAPVHGTNIVTRIEPKADPASLRRSAAEMREHARAFLLDGHLAEAADAYRTARQIMRRAREIEAKRGKA
jgi:hypothetical protein